MLCNCIIVKSGWSDRFYIFHQKSCVVSGRRVFGGQENVVDLGLYRPTPNSYTDTRYLQLNFYTDTDIGVVQRLFTWCRDFGLTSPYCTREWWWVSKPSGEQASAFYFNCQLTASSDVYVLY
jgi:hypothetical protein